MCVQTESFIIFGWSWEVMEVRHMTKCMAAIDADADGVVVENDNVMCSFYFRIRLVTYHIYVLVRISYGRALIVKKL